MVPFLTFGKRFDYSVINFGYFNKFMDFEFKDAMLELKDNYPTCFYMMR
jgi:hypothetical protein